MKVSAIEPADDALAKALRRTKRESKFSNGGRRRKMHKQGVGLGAPR